MERLIDCIIIDLDGTIANLEHRLHHIHKTPKDYDSFNAAMSEDTPIQDTLWLIDLLITAHYEQGGFVFFICTGRPEDCRKQTEQWLWEHAMRLSNVVHKMLMRPSKDFRKDTIIKDEMRQQIEDQGFNIRLVLEDRQQVVDMWREKGITCLQVDQWDET